MTAESIETRIATLTRSILGSVSSAIELLYSMEATSDEGRAIKAWTIYSGVMILDFADSTLTLFTNSQTRGMVALTRSMYEFYITLAYFERHRHLALQQLQTVSGRRLLLASRSHFKDDTARENAKTLYAQWEEMAKQNDLNVFSGNRQFEAMALDIEGETSEKSPTYTVRYSLASKFTHPDGAAIPDVLMPDNDGVIVAWKSRTIDKSAQMLLANDILLDTARLLKERFNSYMTDYNSIHERQAELQKEFLKQKGIP